MKQFILLCLMNMHFFTGFSQENNESENVRTVIIRFFDGLSALDEKIITKEVTSDFVLLEDAEVWNIDSLVNAIQPMKNKNFTRKNKLDFFNVTIEGKTAWVGYYNTAFVTLNGKERTIKWLESAVLSKENGEWKIRLLHSTPMK